MARPSASRPVNAPQPAGGSAARVDRVRPLPSGPAVIRFLQAAVLLVGAIAYCNSFAGVFVFDDQRAILDNPHLRDFTRPQAWWSDTTRPLVQFSLAMNYALGGLEPWGYHAVNLTAHLAAALVLMGLIRRTLDLPSMSAEVRQAAPWIAGGTALLWVVHPLTTAAVTYVIQRSEVFMGLCYLLVLYCLLRGGESEGKRRINGWYVLAVVACWAGVASKEVMVTAPVTAVVFDRVFLAASWREIFRKRWGLYLGLFSSWVLLALLMSSAPKLFETVGFTQRQVGAADYAMNEPAVILHYLRLVFWPSDLAIDYQWLAVGIAQNVLPIAIVALLVILSFALLLTRPVGPFSSPWLVWLGGGKIGFVGAAFFLILAPTSSIVPIADLAFEQRMYLPLAVVLTLVVVAMTRLVQHLEVARPWAPTAAGLLVLLAVATLAGRTLHRNADYHSELALWESTVAARPENARAHDQLGAALLRIGQPVPAVHHAKLAVALAPEFAVGHNNLGRALDALHARGFHPEAAGYYRRAIEIWPGFSDAHNNLANALLQEGKLQDALDHYQLALRAAPRSAKINYHLAVTQAKLGDLPQAIRHFQQALELAAADPLNNALLFVPLHIDFGETLALAGDLPRAKNNFEMVLERQPDSVAAHAALGKVLLAQGNMAEAATHLERAVQLAPERLETRLALAQLYLAQGKPEMAAAEYERVLKVNPAHPDALYFLGLYAEDQGDGPKAKELLRTAVLARAAWAEPALALGWLMSTSSQADVRDGAEAVRLMEGYCRSDGKKRPRAWDTLAAAYAESGRFKDAITAVEQGIDLAESSKTPAEPGHSVDEMQLRLQFYRTGTPFRVIRQGPR